MKQRLFLRARTKPSSSPVKATGGAWRIRDCHLLAHRDFHLFASYSVHISGYFTTSGRTFLFYEGLPAGVKDLHLPLDVGPLWPFFYIPGSITITTNISRS